MKKMMMVAAASVAAWCSWGAERISVDEVINHYPWDGKVDCVVTLSGTENGYFYNGAFELSVKKNGEIVRRVVTNELGMADGIYTNTFDCTALFGMGYYPNGGISVALVKLDYVQLWANGPYIAIRNVGAAKPQDYGYYFWWGDTVGYTRNSANNGWVSSRDGVTAYSFSGSGGNCPTYGKTVAELTSAGYIDGTGNLVAKYDAATAKWGAPWRMPTNEEMKNLVDTSYCTRTWTSNWKGTGVAGYVVTGVQSGYTNKSIFLPAAGEGYDSDIYSVNTFGCYWFSTPYSTGNGNGCALYLASDRFKRDSNNRYRGDSVRPVRSAE